MYPSLCHRLAVPALAVVLLLPLEHALAIGTEATITLRPHCLLGYEEDNKILEEGGDPEQIRCPSFSVEDPQTLRTPDLRAGDILDIDVVVENPNFEELTRVRAWLSYDPNVLQGDTIEVSEEFPVLTPGEADFDTTQGYAMIEASMDGNGPEDLQVFVVRVQFTVLKATPGGTVINFFDVQTGGHTTVVTGTDDEERHLIQTEPGALHIVFAEEGSPAPEEIPTASETAPSAPTPTEEAPQETPQPVAPTGELLTDGEACITNAQCRSSRCLSGICQGAPLPGGAACGSDVQCLSGACVNTVCAAPAASSAAAVSSAPATPAPGSPGAACQSNMDCSSNLCISNVCIPSLDAQRRENPSPIGAPPIPTAADSSAFALLQVQNLRVTTESSSVYLGWETLNSSQLKAYNIYYGTTTGRYIQRKTVEASVKSLAIRSLPVGTTYYFAVRAVNLLDQESAFSQEVAVTVGDPKTSTAPLAAGSIPDNAGPGKNPLQGSVARAGESVPGETGIPSVMLTLTLLSAVIGTGFASRRQMIAASHSPTS